jgi:hypothetical protein
MCSKYIGPDFEIYSNVSCNKIAYSRKKRQHRLRAIEALHSVIPLLVEEGNWIEYGLALPVPVRNPSLLLSSR